MWRYWTPLQPQPGARAASKVVYITTKKGKNMKPTKRINITFADNTESPIAKFKKDMMNILKFIQFKQINVWPFFYEYSWFQTIWLQIENGLSMDWADMYWSWPILLRPKTYKRCL